MVQDKLLTASMGGVLAEQPDPARLRRVLDVGCGAGGWLIEVAQTYPSIELLVGVDLSPRMIEYARELARSRQVEDRVQFHVMDALRMLEFPSDYFDLVNERTAAAYLRTWDWPKLLQECWRVLRRNGIMRMTEGDWLGTSSSPALNRLLELVMAAFYQAGHSFTPSSDGVISELAPLLQRAGFQQVQTRSHAQQYQSGSMKSACSVQYGCSRTVLPSTQSGPGPQRIANVLFMLFPCLLFMSASLTYTTITWKWPSQKSHFSQNCRNHYARVIPELFHGASSSFNSPGRRSP